MQKSYSPFSWLLRARGQRPRRDRTAENGDEIAPFHATPKMDARCMHSQSLAQCPARNNWHRPASDTVSLLSQNRRSDRAPITSGLPRKADKFRARWHFAFVQ
jgi:hypothetical protein